MRDAIKAIKPSCEKIAEPLTGGMRAEPGRGGLGRERRGLSRGKAGGAGNVAGRAGIKRGGSGKMVVFLPEYLDWSSGESEVRNNKVPDQNFGLGSNPREFVEFIHEDVPDFQPRRCQWSRWIVTVPLEQTLSLTIGMDASASGRMVAVRNTWATEVNREMESTSAKHGNWRRPDSSELSSNSLQRTGGKMANPDSSLSPQTSKVRPSKFFECLDMQKVLQELARVEAVCSAMCRKYSTNPRSPLSSHDSRADGQEDGCTNRSGISHEVQPVPSAVPARTPVIVDLSSDDESDGEVVQGSKGEVPAVASEPCHPSPVSDVDKGSLKRKAAEANIGEQDAGYEPHVFEVPQDLQKADGNEVDKTAWNQTAAVVSEAQLSEIDPATGAGDVSLRRKRKKARKNERVAFMTDQIIVLESDDDKDIARAAALTLDRTVDLVTKSLSAGLLTGKASLVMKKKGRKKSLKISVKGKVGRPKGKGMKSGKVSAQEKAARRQDKEKKKLLARDRKLERIGRIMGRMNQKVPSKKAEENLVAETEDECEDKSPKKTPKKDPAAEEAVQQIQSILDGEKVVYEPYVWRNSVEEKDNEDPELEDIWQDMATVVAVSSTTAVFCPAVQSTPVEKTKGSGQESKTCSDGKHVDVDYDEDDVYYCAHCGAWDIDPPENEAYLLDQDEKVDEKSCEHKNRAYKEEVGQYCVDCGLVGKDIQKTFIPEVSFPARARPKSTEAREFAGEGAVSRISLKVQDANTNEEYGEGEIELHLHTLYENMLHPHQKEGFEFLKRNILGEKQGRSLGCILAHAPGTGKTLLIVSFIQSFLAKMPDGRPLILAPKIMLKAWRDEFLKFKVEDIPIFDLLACNPGGMICEEDDDDAEFTNPSERLTRQENRAKVLKEWQGSRGVLLMSYHLFSNLVEKGVSEQTLPGSLDHRISKVLIEAPGLVVLDEGHLVRTKRTKILQSLMQMRTKRRILLSGTLFQNNFKELYTLLKLCREDFMTSQPEYARRLANLCGLSVGRNGDSSTYSLRSRSTSLQQHEENIFTHDFGDILENYVKGEGATTISVEEINKVVRNLRSLCAPFVHWYLGKILETLPGLIEYSVHLNLTTAQEKVISEVCQPPSKNHMARTCKVLAACIHPSLVKYEQNIPDPKDILRNVKTSESLQLEVFQGVKIEFVVRMAELCVKANEKLLIFCTNLVPLRYIEEVFIRLYSWERGQQFFRLDGTMPDHDRQSVISMFNNSRKAKDGVEPHVLLASTKACKEGITLVGASRVIILDTPDNPSVLRQAVSRAFRIGQKRKVYVYRLVTTNKEEESLFRRSVNKEKLSKVLLDRVGKTSVSIDDFLQELSLSEVKDELLSKLMQDDGNRAINVVRSYNATGC
ncbi:hypothetical protein R1sor_015202 [Riccia sorocarpa]|uniref:Uncharacterized protein n=1 Tax=Riccia sorocarpa TaxID=122646 RepID=A0ABD3HBL3_9MARC